MNLVATKSRPCKYCGVRINFREMRQGQWVAFEGYEKLHKCDKTGKKKSAAAKSFTPSTPLNEKVVESFIHSAPKMKSSVPDRGSVLDGLTFDDLPQDPKSTKQTGPAVTTHPSIPGGRRPTTATRPPALPNSGSSDTDPVYDGEAWLNLRQRHINEQKPPASSGGSLVIVMIVVFAILILLWLIA